MDGDQPARQKFKAYPIGYFHIDIAEVRTGEGKLYLFVAIDRTSKLAFARLKDKANVAGAVAFLDELVEAVPYDIHTVLTDNVLCREAAAGLGQQISMRRQPSAQHAI